MISCKQLISLLPWGQMWYCKLCNWLCKTRDIFYTKCGRYLSDSFVRTRKHLDIFNGLGSSSGYFGGHWLLPLFYWYSTMVEKYYIHKTINFDSWTLICNNVLANWIIWHIVSIRNWTIFIILGFFYGLTRTFCPFKQLLVLVFHR